MGVRKIVPIVFAAFAAFSAAAVPGMPSKAGRSALSSQDSMRFNYFFIEGAHAFSSGDYDAAYDLFAHCLSINPDAAEALYHMGVFHAALGNDSAAMAAKERAAAISPGNATYVATLGDAYVEAGDFGRAAELYSGLYKADPSRTDLLDRLSSIYYRAGDYLKAVGAVEEKEKTDGRSEETTLTKVWLYDNAGKPKKSLKALQQLAADHPGDPYYRVMMGNWLLQHGQPDKAYKLFVQAAKEDPGNTFVQTSLADYYAADGRDSMAAAVRTALIANPGVNLEAKLSLIRLMSDENDKNGGGYSAITELFGKAVEANPTDADALYEMNAAYLSAKNAPPTEVASALRRWIDDSPGNNAPVRYLVANLMQRGEWEEVAGLCRKAVETAPGDALMYSVGGSALYQMDDLDGALEMLLRGVENGDKAVEPRVVSDMYYYIGDIYHQKGSLASAYAAYDSCLAINPDNVPCLNNYAYFLSEDKGGDLQKAALMSYRTVTAEPANPTYLDTYAWILFKQRKYADAKLYIDRAMVAYGDSANGIVSEHAGDIYYHNGDTLKAIEYWMEALKKDGFTDLLPEKARSGEYIKPEEE